MNYKQAVSRHFHESGNACKFIWVRNCYYLNMYEVDRHLLYKNYKLFMLTTKSEAPILLRHQATLILSYSLASLHLLNEDNILKLHVTLLKVQARWFTNY
jgi:hypothetical protein